MMTTPPRNSMECVFFHMVENGVGLGHLLLWCGFHHFAQPKSQAIEHRGHRTGLAAASVPKPTVAQYTQCFSYLQIAKLAKESGLYGEAPRHEVMVMLDNFPEKCVSMGEHIVPLRITHPRK